MYWPRARVTQTINGNANIDRDIQVKTHNGV